MELLFSRFALFAVSFWIFARCFLEQAMCFLLKMGGKKCKQMSHLSSIVVVECPSCNL